MCLCKWKDIKEWKTVDSGERERMGLSIQGMSSFDRIKVTLSITTGTIRVLDSNIVRMSLDLIMGTCCSSLFFSVPGKL